MPDAAHSHVYRQPGGAADSRMGDDHGSKLDSDSDESYESTIDDKDGAYDDEAEARENGLCRSVVGPSGRRASRRGCQGTRRSGDGHRNGHRLQSAGQGHCRRSKVSPRCLLEATNSHAMSTVHSLGIVEQIQHGERQLPHDQEQAKGKSRGSSEGKGLSPSPRATRRAKRPRAKARRQIPQSKSNSTQNKEGRNGP